MQLKRLEAYGFKSFADKIDIEFDRGITAIVGPNGSGKSNISDAIKWVLGEQNIRSLRGNKSEDIIFAGSDSRKPMGAAEVSLYFDNDGTLPIDFSEVVITRRLMRNGESEFFINRSRCRLKDIVELFADSGIGSDSMGIISQNKMDAILNAKPEERRTFFEEAAGITRYRSRKREATKKLEETENNLQRVRDILGEIEKQKDSLRSSAEKAKQYQDLQRELSRVSLSLAYRQYLSLLEEKEIFLKELADKREQAEAGKTALGLLEEGKAHIEQEIAAFEKAFSKLSEKKNKLYEQIEGHNGELRVLAEREAQGNSNYQRITESIERLQSRQLEISKEIEALEKGARTAQEKKTAMAEGLEEKRRLAKGLRTRLIELGKERELAQQSCEKASKKLAEQGHYLALLEHDISNSVMAKEKLEENHRKSIHVLDGHKREKELLVQREKELLKNYNNNNETLKSLDNELGKLIREKNSLQEEISKKSLLLQGGKSRLQLLEKLQLSYEGFGGAVKAVLKSKEPWRQEICGAVAEILQVPGKYITAIETALGAGQQNIVTENDRTAKEAIGFLKKEKAGRVTFLPLSNIRVSKNNEPLPQNGQGILGWGSELVWTEEKYSPIKEFLLGRTLVVDTLDNALRLAKSTNHRLRMVTLEGELLSPGGALSGGSYRQREGSFLNRQEEINKLNKELNLATEELSSLATKKTEVDKLYQEKEAAQQELRNKINALQLKVKEISISIENKAQLIGQFEQELQVITEQLTKSHSYEEELVARKKLLIQEEAIFQEENNKAIDVLQAILREHAQQEEEAERLAKENTSLELDKTVLEQQFIRLKEQIMLNRRELERNQSVLALEEKEIEALRHSLEEWKTLAKVTKEQLEVFQKNYQELLQEYKQQEEKNLALKKDRKRNDEEIQLAMAKEKQLQEKIHEMEIKGAKFDYDREQYENDFLATYGLVVERVAQEADTALSKGELRKKEATLKHTIEKLGAINLAAPEEYEEICQRHLFLSGNEADLSKGREDLLLLIREMENTMSQLFVEAFAQINRFFAEIFVALFGGGRAEITLSDHKDVLSAGVNILITIPGKKQQNLSVLSGGERALTVVALLFAFLRYRPAPFSILDEIDAPLDEANIGRFGAFLQEYAQGTQFVIVTHRKGTMEVADTMYGVTIEDAGVSRILSVSLRGRD